MGEEEIHQLVKGCLKNDRLSQKLLYKAFYGFAMGICLRYATNRYEASEIMNQGFFKVFKNIDKYDADKPLKAWVGRIMINTSVDYYRANLKISQTEELENAGHFEDYNYADRNLSYNELLAMVSRLTPAYRTIFNLYAIEGYSHDEIADMLNISPGTSKSNLHKAREKLKVMVSVYNRIPGIAGGEQSEKIVPMNGTDLRVSFMANMNKK